MRRRRNYSLASLVLILTINKHFSHAKQKTPSSEDQNDVKFSDFHELPLELDEESEENHPQSEETTTSEESDVPHSRQKRLIWVTDDGRLALPPGTSLTITPTLSLPFVRYPPDGFFSNISISLPLTIDFDKLGLTDNQNPLGVLPPIFARSMGRAAGSMLAHYLTSYLKTRRRGQRNSAIKINQIDAELPDSHKHAFHGGERALLYSYIEDLLDTFGMDGKACLLRTICEVHSIPVHRYGLAGEMFKLFLTPTSSPYAELLMEYMTAENTGRGVEPPGECFPYYKACPKSLFRKKFSKYSKTDDQKREPRSKQAGEGAESSSQPNLNLNM